MSRSPACRPSVDIETRRWQLAPTFTRSLFVIMSSSASASSISLPRKGADLVPARDERGSVVPQMGAWRGFRTGGCYRGDGDLPASAGRAIGEIPESITVETAPTASDSTAVCCSLLQQSSRCSSCLAPPPSAVKGKGEKREWARQRRCGNPSEGR